MSWATIPIFACHGRNFPVRISSAVRWMFWQHHIAQIGYPIHAPRSEVLDRAIESKMGIRSQTLKQSLAFLFGLLQVRFWHGS